MDHWPSIMLFPIFVIFAGKERQKKSVDKPFFTSLIEALKYKPFFQVIIMYICAWLPIKVLMAAMLYYFKYYLGMTKSFELIMGIMMVVSVLSLPLWNLISKKLDKRRAYIIGLLTFAFFILMLLLPKSIVTALLIPLAVFIGVGLSSLHIMPVAIVPEAIDAGIADGVAASEGIWNGVVTFVQKTASAIAIFLLGVALDITGYDAGVLVQNSATLSMLKILVAVVPALLTITGVLVAMRFKIGRK
jgi:GPH family glycoside/pentoside/hexuronide:cation symporter